MQIGSKLLTALAVTMLVLTTSPGGASAADKDDIRPWQGELPVRDAWLREWLPDNALLYLRIPHPLGFVTVPKGNAMDNALRSTANVENVIEIQGALIENVLEYVPGFEEAYLRDFVAQLRSPVEVAMTLVPTPSAIVAMNLDIGSADDFEVMINNVVIAESSLALLEPLDADGFGQLLGLPVPTAVHFDVDTGQLLIQSGPSVSAESFAMMVESLVETTDHKMHVMERQIDSSGHGFFGWVDAESAIPAARMFMDEEQTVALQESGMDQVRALGMGWGAAGGKGRMSVIVDMPRDGDRQYLPYISNEIQMTSVGEPDALIVLSIPTAEEFVRIETVALEAASEESRQAWLDGKDEIEEATGIRIENVLSAIGPEVVAIFDDAGDYWAIRLRDPDLFDQFVGQVSETSGSAPIERRYKRHTFYHWALSTEIDSIDDSDDAALDPMTFILARQREHIHWYRDGDFLYLAGVPQPLIDRVDTRPDTDIGDWLEKQQNMDLSSSVLAATGTSDKLPRRLYYIYLELLQAVADIGEADFDIWSMPTSAQAKLPDKGALGFSVNLGDPYLSMNFMFENNPLESIFSGDMTSVAAIGILAAIAIPAYDDYTVRAKVSQGLLEATPVQAAVTEHYQAEGAFPGPTVAAELSNFDPAGEHVQAVTVMPASGIIMITFTEAALPEGGEVYLEPVVDDAGGLDWVCSGSIEDGRLPEMCRETMPPELDLGGT